MTLEQTYNRAHKIMPDVIKLVRVGDFYETLHDDARTISKLLGLPLTESNGVAMCGFQERHLEAYLGKLLKEGRRAAVCEVAK